MHLAALRMLCSLLEERFQVLPEGLREELGRIKETSRLEALLRHAVRSASLEDFAGGL